MRNFTARLVTALVLTLLASVAVAQIHDSGVSREVDEFTGVETCSQVVFHSFSNTTGLAMFLDNDGSEPLVYLIRHLPDSSSATFNMFGKLSGDAVYIRFSENDVVQLRPDDVTVEVEFMEDGWEAAIFISREVAYRLMAAPSDLRVRFSGSETNSDFTIRHDVVTAVAQGFGQECL